MLRVTRKLNISTSLYVLFGIAALVMSSEALVGVFHAWAQVGEGARVEQLASANQELFAALQYIRQERVPTRVALDLGVTPQLVRKLIRVTLDLLAQRPDGHALRQGVGPRQLGRIAPVHKHQLR